MSCWFPSSSQESWFPQLRINRLAREKAEAAAAEVRLEPKEPVAPKPKRKAAAAE